MTIWFPDLSSRRGPRYLALADALADDIEAGRLRDGDRLPTHRDLAYRLGVTVGTVSRAYAEAARRGLVSGEVGRGTYVRGAPAAPSGFFRIPDKHPPGVIDFALNLPVLADAPAHVAAAAERLLRGGNNLLPLLDYQPEMGIAHHRAAASHWLTRAGVEVGPERVVVTTGAQHGMAAIFMSIARPGALVLTEALTWPGMKDLADRLHLRTHGLAMDDQGLRPDAFEAACKSLEPLALYTMPSLQNPTTAVMGEARRQEVVAIARRYGVQIVEDDVYGFLLGNDQPTPLAALAPDCVYYVTSLAKCLMPGLRVGFVAAPPGKAEAVGASIRATVRMTPPLMAEIVAGWIEDGTADAMAENQLREVAARQAIARPLLQGLGLGGNPNAFHLWLPLPEGWRNDEFVAAARDRNVLFMGADPFVVGRGQPPRYVRLCLGAPRSREEVEQGIRIVAELLSQPRPTGQAVV
jgi:DNA-binding transcriptional MocR family regulator